MLPFSKSGIKEQSLGKLLNLSRHTVTYWSLLQIQLKLSYFFVSGTSLLVTGSRGACSPAEISGVPHVHEMKSWLQSFTEPPPGQNCHDRPIHQSERCLIISGNDHPKRAFSLLKERGKFSSKDIPSFRKVKRTKKTFLKECRMTPRASDRQFSCPCTVWSFNCLFGEVLEAAWECSHNPAIWHTWLLRIWEQLAKSDMVNGSVSTGFWTAFRQEI